jgi:putative tricarboxylic transport membrane protein
VSAGTQARAGALTALAVGGLAGWQAHRLGVGSLTAPGPGLWPLIVSVILVLTGAAVALHPGDDAEVIGREAWIVVLGCLSLVAYTLLFEVVGFEIPTIALLVFWLKVLGGDTWRTAVTVAVGATAAVYLVFIFALGVALPHLA